MSSLGRLVASLLVVLASQPVKADSCLSLMGEGSRIPNSFDAVCERKIPAIRRDGADSEIAIDGVPIALESVPLTEDLDAGLAEVAETSSLRITRVLRKDGNASIRQVTTVRNIGEHDIAPLQVRVPFDLAWRSDSVGDGLAGMLYAYRKVVGSSKSQITGALLKEEQIVVYVRHGFVRYQIAASESVEFSFDQTLEPGIAFAEVRSDALPPQAEISLSVLIDVYPSMGGAQLDTVFDGIMYSGLWEPLAWLCRWIERFLILMSGVFGNVVVGLVLFAIGVRLLTFPVNKWSATQQKKFSDAQARMAPYIAEAKETYKGAQQSERIVAIYKQFRITPLSGFKGSVGLLLQLPVLIAVFNVTTESALFKGETLLWINDLSMPDRLLDLGHSLPVLGSGFNLLPLLLGGVGWYSARMQGSANSGGLWLHAIITVLFYSFASALVLYWLTVNVLQAIEAKISARLAGS